MWIFTALRNLYNAMQLQRAFEAGERYGQAREQVHSELFEAQERAYDEVGRHLEHGSKEYREWEAGQEAIYEEAQRNLKANNWHGGCGRVEAEVICILCGSEHLAIGGIQYNQGSDCCAWTYEKDGQVFLSGGYGSTVADMYKYTVSNKAGLVAGIDPICDCCIISLINRGLISEVGPTNLTWGAAGLTES